MDDTTQVKNLIERDRVASIINELFVATDARNWRACAPASRPS